MRVTFAETFRLLQTISFVVVMQTMEDRTVSEEVRRLEGRMEERFEQRQISSELRTEIRGLRGDIQSMPRIMLCGFFSLACLMFAYAGFQLA